MHIDTNVYYFIPAIFDAYRKECGGFYRIKEWSKFIIAKHLGVVPYVSDVSPHVGIHAHGDLKQFLVFYRIVDSKQFLVTSLQLGIVIDDTTPTIHHDEHRS